MKSLRQVLLGVIIALASILLVLGGFSLSLAEANFPTTPVPSAQTLTPTHFATLQAFTPPAGSPTISPSMTLTVSFTATPTPSAALTSTQSSSLTSTWTPVPSASQGSCPLPVGWVYYIVQSGDTLDKIAARYRISSVELQQKNCQSTLVLSPGMTIFIPQLATQTRIPCGPPSTWVRYFVQPGDTLYRLSLTYGVSVAQLQQANCLSNPDTIKAGQMLYVPAVAARTPFPTITMPIIPTSTQETPVLLTNTPETPVPPTDTPETPVPPTDTTVPTETPVPTDMPTPTEVQIPTEPSATP